MEIKNFFQKIFSGSREPDLPKPVRNKFEARFSESINVEWQKTGEQFEAVFYRDDLEHIATFDADGSVVCLKINLPLTVLPELINQNARKEGELMNAIRIECKDEIQYEMIVRDEMLVRYTLLLNVEGKILNKKQL